MMRILLFVLLFTCAANGEEPSIVFDNRPEAGVPPEALAQEASSRSAPGDVKTFRTLTDRTIKTIRIRYFNKKTWATEQQAGEYVVKFLAHKSMDVYETQIWSQSVGVPEIECVVEFSDEHRKQLREERTESYREGRLLIWKTESCFRDATGKWWFVNAFDHFHRSHPNGDRTLAKKSMNQ